MYKKFFGLKENPFNVNPDPRYLFLTPHTQEALACLTYGIETRKGFILLTGEVGTGKTTLINKLLEWLHKERVFTAFVFNPRLSVSQFFDFMMADFGIPCESHQKGQMLVKLNQWLLDRYQAGERAVLVVDEAQNLSPQMLEEIRLLKNCFRSFSQASPNLNKSSTSPSFGSSASASRFVPRRASSLSRKPTVILW